MVEPAAFKIPEAFGYTAELASARGAVSIKDLPGCFEMQIDARWWCAINGHGEPTECSRGVKVTPYGVYFERDGWPCWIVDPRGGSIAGPEGMEDELIAAVKAATPQEPTREA